MCEYYFDLPEATLVATGPRTHSPLDLYTAFGRHTTVEV